MHRLFALTCLFTLLAAHVQGERPNILWITSEDNSPLLGCYGDPQAHTPRLDQLATESVRYTHAYANAPVCSVARSTLIMGMYAPTLGLHHHRSRVPVPARFRMYPDYLRGAGYYCTNNSKTDYNTQRNLAPVWDANSRKAHYRNRKPGQPFFAIFNLGRSHEGQIFPGNKPTDPTRDPAAITLPPHHPDTPEIRRDWAVYYDRITEMDAQAGRLLDELEQEGLADDTIVFYYADHGGILPRSKRSVRDSGTRVPLIVRFPEAWKSLAPAPPGRTEERLVSFIDLPPTLLSLAGVHIPEAFQGRAFLGAQKQAADELVFLYRGRMDERYDMVRAVTDGRYRYIHNYAPHRPDGQHYFYPFKMQSMQSWHQAWKAGQCTPEQAAFWEPRPAEELYDTATDPWEVHNLAGRPDQAKRLARMREQCRDRMLQAKDTGFIPEAMFGALGNSGSLYDYAQGEAYPLSAIITVADLAVSGDAKALPRLRTALRHQHPVIRYWGAVGCTVLDRQAVAARGELTRLLDDAHANVRIAAAEALGHTGETVVAIKALRKELTSRDDLSVLYALNALEYLDAELSTADLAPILREPKHYFNSAEVAKHLRGK